MRSPYRRRRRWPVVLLAVLALVAVVVVAVASVSTDGKPKSLPPAGFGYWHTSGTRVVDAYNRPVRIASVTWFGAESRTWVPAGLDFQPYRRIMREVKRLGYNTIRLPFCNQLVEENPIITGWVSRNPQFLGKRALSVFDAIARYARRIDLKIILDDQISRCEGAARNRAGATTRLNEPLWYTRRYPQSAWIHDWKVLARRYKGNSAVVGFDLRNEPHTSGPGLPVGQGSGWGIQAYLHQGSTWGRYRGIEHKRTDWRLAAERCGNAILKINPKLLIFVEGLQLYPQANQPHGVDSYWWGGILKQVKKYPVRLKQPHQLVYSPHEYGPQKWPKYWWWKHLTYKRLAHVLNRQWGFILNHPRARWAAPIFLGETGTCTNYTFCVSTNPGRRSPNRITRIKRKQGRWLHLLVRYIHRHPNLGWSLWALNGTTALDHISTDGLLNARWDAVQSWKLQNLLATIQKR